MGSRQITDMSQGTRQINVTANLFWIALVYVNSAVAEDWTSAGMLDDFPGCAIIIPDIVDRIKGIGSRWEMQRCDLCFDEKIDVSGRIAWWTLSGDVKMTTADTRYT